MIGLLVDMGYNGAVTVFGYLTASCLFSPHKAQVSSINDVFEIFLPMLPFLLDLLLLSASSYGTSSDSILSLPK